MVTSGEHGPHHFREKNNRSWKLGDEIVEESNEYKNLGIVTTNFAVTHLLQFLPNSTLLLRDAQCDEILVRVSSNSIGYLMKRSFISLFFHVYYFQSFISIRSQED